MGSTLKLVVLLLLATAIAYGQGSTPGIGLALPSHLEQNWDSPLNQNFTTIDLYLSGIATAPGFKTRFLGITNLGDGYCLHTAGGFITTTATECQNLNFTYSGPTTSNITTYDPANFTGTNALICRKSNGDITTSGCPTIGGGVVSVFGRSGTVSAQSGDYSIGQISGMNFSGTNTTNFATYGTFTGSAGAITCKDASGNITTVGCSSGAGGSVLLSPPGDQAIVTPSGHMFNTNVLEQWVFADNYAPSSSGGINEAFTACGNSGHCVVWAPIGTTSACNISVPSSSVLRGHARSSTTTNLQCGTVGAPTVADVGSNSRVENIAVSHSSSPSSGGDGIVTSGDRVVLSNIRSFNNWNGFRLGGVTFGETYGLIAEQNNNAGVLFDTGLGTTTMQWVVNGGLYQKNATWGLDFVNSTATNYTAPRIVGNIHVFGNHVGGVRIQATSTGRVDNFQLDGCNLSQNDGDSVLLDTNGLTNGVANCHIEQSGGNLGGGTQALWGFNAASGTGVPSGVGNGIHITSNCSTSNGSPYLIANNRFYQDSDDAILVACDDSQIIGNNIYDPGYNHLSGGAANVRAGIAVQGTKVQVTGNFCQQGGSRSLSCIDISNGADKPSLSGNSYGAGYSDSTMVSVTTQPANGFREFFGNAMWIQQNAAASGSCQNGSIWTRTDSTGGWYLCVNNVWVTK